MPPRVGRDVICSKKHTSSTKLAPGIKIPTAISLVVGDSSNGYKGAIDEVRIWSSALTTSMTKLYEATELNGDESGLAAYYRFGEELKGLDTLDATGGGATCVYTHSPNKVKPEYPSAIYETTDDETRRLGQPDPYVHLRVKPQPQRPLNLCPLARSLVSPICICVSPRQGCNSDAHRHKTTR